MDILTSINSFIIGFSLFLFYYQLGTGVYSLLRIPGGKVRLKPESWNSDEKRNPYRVLKRCILVMITNPPSVPFNLTQLEKNVCSMTRPFLSSSQCSECAVPPIQVDSWLWAVLPMVNFKPKGPTWERWRGVCWSRAWARRALFRRYSRRRSPKRSQNRGSTAEKSVETSRKNRVVVFECGTFLLLCSSMHYIKKPMGKYGYNFNYVRFVFE